MARTTTMRALAQEAQTRVRTDLLGVHAGSLTYGAFLAIPPLLILGFTVLSLVLANDVAAQQRVIDSVTTLVPGLDEVIGSQFNQATAQQLGIGLVGIVVLLWAVSSFAVRVRTALGVVFRTGVPTLLAGRVSGTGIGLLVVAGFAVYATVAAQVLAWSLPGWIKLVLVLVVAFIGVGLFLLVYWALTPPGDDRPTLGAHVPGAVVFVVIGLLLERLGAFYVAHVVTRATALYGAIGTIFGLFAFLYVAMWAFLVGAEVSQITRERR
jgi:YihY family inner membrane protein